jgi:hypothetical protein
MNRIWVGVVVAAVCAPPVFADVVAEWHMDEGQGTVVDDSSGNDRDGTVVGASWTDGILGHALRFNGASFVTAPNVPTSEFTLEAWIRAGAAPAEYGTILEKWLTGQGGAWILSLQPALNPRLDWGVSGSGIATDSTVPVELRKWHYLAATVSYDSGTNLSSSRVYLDGELVGSLTNNPDAGPPTSYETGVTIGASKYDDGPATQYFTGVIDEVTIYDRPLSEEEIRHRYQNTLLRALLHQGSRER